MAGLALAAALAGCAMSGSQGPVLPHDGPTMVEIYRQHMESLQQGTEGAVRERLPLRDAVDPTPGERKRAAMDRIENRFPRLPNPDLVMTVFPHMAKGHYPVPGYVTVFPMYETVEYAMPGEVPTRRTVQPGKDMASAAPARKE